MYNKRIKIFVIFSVLLLLVCLLRLTQMQLLPDSSLQDDIAELKRQRGLFRQLKTLRGRILDRKGRILAVDELRFQLCINYGLSSFLDEHVRQAKLLRTTRQAQRAGANLTLSDVRKELKAKLEDLQQIIEKCTYFGLERADIENKIKTINDDIWNLREHLAWKRNCPNQDFAQAVPDANGRLLLTAQVDIAEMHKSWPLLELKTDDDIFAAQLEFMDVDGIQILPTAQRFYPFGSVAAQTIGWVGSPQEVDRRLFAEDKLSSYLSGEVCGREDGVEYVCEAILRGRRGEVVYDIDRQLISRTETQFGKDISLTLDIELQKKIEDYLANCNLNANCKKPTAAVVIDVTTSDILALVSMPAFNLNRIRYDYDMIALDPNEPLRNRAINKQYPPGSVVKPLILIAGLESGKITPDEIISCPAKPAPKGWPSCWLYNKYPWMGHNDKWRNSARNAIKGSCNIYFSRLADRIDPSVLQQWLFKFGYGRQTPLGPPTRSSNHDSRFTIHESRNLRQVQGIISSSIPKGTILDFEQVLPLKGSERRYFGMGQGNLRATPLQAANAFATIARGGVLKQPRLFKEISNFEFRISNFQAVRLGISPQTLDIIRDGMSAVVNEPGGTAYKEFAYSGLAGQGITVYGKTGSTEKPDNAWFAGFATDSAGRSIVITLVIEGGQHGSSDAAPLARDIIQFCIEAGYIGSL